MGSRFNSGGELGGELSEAEVLATASYQAECGYVPKACAAAVTEHNLIAIGCRKQISQALPETTYHRADGFLAMTGAQVARRSPFKGRHGLRADFGRARAKAAVLWEQAGGNGDVRDVCHVCKHVTYE